MCAQGALNRGVTLAPYVATLLPSPMLSCYRPNLLRQSTISKTCRISIMSPSCAVQHFSQMRVYRPVVVRLIDLWPMKSTKRIRSLLLFEVSSFTQ